MILSLATAVVHVSLSQALLVASSAATRDDNDHRQNGVSFVGNNNGLLLPDDGYRSHKVIERMLLHSPRPLPLMRRRIQRRVRHADKSSGSIHCSSSDDEDGQLADETPDAGIFSTSIQSEGKSYAAGINENVRGLDETSYCVAAGHPQDLCDKCVSIDCHYYSPIHYGFLDPQNAQDEECREAAIDFCASGDFSDIVEYHQGHSTDPCSLTAFDVALLTSMPAWYCDYHLCYAKQYKAMLDNASDLSITGNECDSVLIASYCIRMKQACEKLDASVGSCAFDNPSYYCEQYNEYRDCPELPAGYSLASSSTDKGPGESLSLGTAVITASAAALAGGQCLL